MTGVAQAPRRARSALRVREVLWSCFWIACLGTLSSCARRGPSLGNVAPAAVAGQDGGMGAVRALRIAMIAKSSTNPFFLAARTGAEAAARRLSQTHGVSIEVVWLTPPQEDARIQALRVAQAVDDGMDAILVSCSDAVKVTAAIDAAVDRGVPVMTFDSDAPSSKRFSYYGVDDVETGRRVMDELAGALHGKGHVAILAGNRNAPNLRHRADGVRLAAQKYPDIHIVDTFFHVETPQDAVAEVLGANRAHPDINGWAMVGGWALATRTLLGDLDPRKMSIVAIDALPPMLVYVERGLAPVLLAQATYEWGSVGVETIVNKVLLHQTPPVIIPMELVRVSRASLGSWARRLKEWGFADVPEEYLLPR